ncbi:MAG: hypothetical protein QOE14_1272 [Humisphaera sp.]|nr:hypothetical protein [Humisphaera sp.]
MMQVSRREMLRVGLGGLAAISLGETMPAFVSKFAINRGVMRASPISNDNILVIVQLSGGNDGLNTVIPVGDEAYFSARPTIGLTDRLHALENGLALNPAMSAFKELFDDGRLAIVNGCGYPNPNRSHFKSMEVWHTADPMKPQTSGWLGHYVDHLRRGTESVSLRAINIGTELPQALVADHENVPSIPSVDGGAPVAMEYLARQATNAVIDPGAIERAAARYRPDANYPGGLGQQLRLIAQLIAANLGTKIFYCQISGFDTHANQLGQHERLLGNVSSAIAAFTNDMKSKGLGEKVAVMCFSEFGRRVNQNTSAGTDHGAAGPMFIVGGKVKRGIYGAHPSLTDLDDGDLKYTTDFRRVYATLLDRWLNTSSSAILNNTFEPMAFL